VKLKILHVSEAFGGGIVSSLYSFASNAENFEHHILACEREDQPLSKNLSEIFASVNPMRRNIFDAIADIRSMVNGIKPDFVHLHSSYAGVYGRISGLPRHKIIYSPHGFAFERRSSPFLLRAFYYGVEKLLSRRSETFAGVSLEEVKTATKLNKRVRAVFVPNTTDIRPDENVSVDPARPMSIKVTCAGRLCDQKDPRFLMATLNQLSREVRERLVITWIGSGDKRISRKLSDAGVRVTGWLTHEEATRELGSCDLYLHVAAWEGFPMTVIEAAALGRPIMLRRISAFCGFGLPDEAFVGSHKDAAERIGKWVISAEQRRETALLTRKVREITSVGNQRAALSELYNMSSA
jgi:glycosyltransferase involved in cell wall biosynthesis